MTSHAGAAAALPGDTQGPSQRAGWSLPPQVWIPLVGVAFGILLVVGPVVATLVRSLLYWPGETPTLSLQNFTALVSDPRFRDAVLNTLICGLGATIFSTLLGFSLAWIVSRTDLPGRSWFEVGNLIPFFLSPYVGAEAWIALASPNSGLLQRLATDYAGLSFRGVNIFSLGGVVFVLSIFYTPYVYLMIISPLRRMDAALEDAARVHGASFAYTMRHITIPLLLPALLSGAAIVFVTSAGLFDVPFALAASRGIRTLPTEIYASVQYPADFGRAAACGVLVMALPER